MNSAVAEHAHARAADSTAQRQASLATRLAQTRAATVALLDGLSPEDCQIQSMPDASPMKWHLGHVGWFFETFVLSEHAPGYQSAEPAFRELFNSYYVGVGPRTPRAQRGLMSRPAFDTVFRYQQRVLDQVLVLMHDRTLPDALLDTIELGINHEQQHQELILTDLKHHLSCNMLLPAYRPEPRTPAGVWPQDKVAYPFLRVDAGLRQIGSPDAGFAFDNERPLHRVWLDAYEIGARPVLNGEYLAFIRDGGYRRPEFWLAEGWDVCVRSQWQAPLYWLDTGDAPQLFTLAGVQPLDPFEPVTHLSYFEADAYARWAGASLPTEAQWEVAALALAPWRDGGFVESQRHHPHPLHTLDEKRLGGDVWEWTQSAYLPYPGFETAAGAVGEYNGKFMVNQMVLRGGSCATPRSHIRPAYRNFFPTCTRWQFSGLRLARQV